jgi:hypothetical protein
MTLLKISKEMLGHPMTCLCRHRGEVDIAQPNCNLGTRRGVCVVITMSGLLYPQGKTQYPLQRGWVGLGPGLDGYRKSHHHHQDSNPGPSSPSSYTNYSIQQLPNANLRQEHWLHWLKYIVVYLSHSRQILQYEC